MNSLLQGEDTNGGPNSLWVDDEDKRFYEELRELRGEVPGSVLGVKVKEEEGAVEKSEEKKEKDVEVEVGDLEASKVEDEKEIEME